MGWFSIFKRKDARHNHMFDDKDRELSLERKRMNIELENAKKKNMIAEENMRHKLEMAQMQDELDELTGYDDDDDDDGKVSTMLLSLFDKAKSLTPAASPQPQTIASSPAGVSISDEDLKQLWDGVPQMAKDYAPKCTDAQVCEFIKVKMLPQADDETIQRALKVVRQYS